jgi:hypothetical protein
MDEVDKRRRTTSEYSEGVITVEEKGKRGKGMALVAPGLGTGGQGPDPVQEPAEVEASAC